MNPTLPGNGKPNPWSSAANGGFSPEGVTTRLPVNPNHALGVNVADQREDEGSLLHLYRRLLHARRRHDALSRGDCVLLNTDAPSYLAFLRSVEGQSCLVIVNMAPREQLVELDLPAGELRLVVSTRVRAPVQDARAPILLAAHEGWVAAFAPTTRRVLPSVDEQFGATRVSPGPRGASS
jgi:glycosidase